MEPKFKAFLTGFAPARTYTQQKRKVVRVLEWWNTGGITLRCETHALAFDELAEASTQLQHFFVRP